jgi:DNA polymerase-3 subunit gamma/tau
MISLANKYRPNTWEDVVGQEHVVTILRNQLQARDTKQGYLFTGGAGTGKTTNARIFAKAINLTDDGKQLGEVIEIDAASNNGVDNVRDLREGCKFKPLSGGYKVYVIDEVHMLSTGAFNALLKTLEEPPAHAVFILCTTDPQKIPATILSRVQRFDFRRMTVQQLADRLRYIVDEENGDEIPYMPKYLITDEALQYIAKIANGGMRDAISLLDTVLGYGSNEELEVDDVMKLLGVTSHQTYINLIRAVLEGDQAAMLQMIENEHLAGRDLKNFVKGMAEFLVDLRKLAMLGDMEYVAAPPLYEDQMLDLMTEMREAGESFRKWFTAMNTLMQNIRYESQPKALIQGEFLLL